MPDYIVDASVVIEHLVAGTSTPFADNLFLQTRYNAALVIPEFCLLECTNVIWKQVRFQGMTLNNALITLKDLRALPLTRVPSKRILRDALEIALRHQLAVYDAAYLALARIMTIPLISLDVPQIRAGNTEGIAIKPLTDFT